MNKNFILKPVVTEKSLRLAADGKFTFAISAGVNKIIIGQVISKKYNVEVVGLNVIKTPGKPKGKLRGSLGGRTKNKTKIIVTLKKGQTIPGFQIAENAEADHEHDHDDKNKKDKSKK